MCAVRKASAPAERMTLFDEPSRDPPSIVARCTGPANVEPPSSEVYRWMLAAPVASNPLMLLTPVTYVRPAYVPPVLSTAIASRSMNGNDAVFFHVRPPSGER